MLLGQRSSRRFRIWWLQAFAPSSLWPPPARHYLSRRIAKTLSTGTTNFLYHGWNLCAEYTGSTLTKTYTCGMDLSGSMQGAGGVGGLLSVREGSDVYYPTYDANGNVSEYLDKTGATVAHYEYDAFGNTTASTGTKKDDFAHRFSTKYQDDESGLYYYGYRYYDPVTGRWPSRDPIVERGGLNLYEMISNNAVNFIDRFGLKPGQKYESYIEALLAASDDVATRTTKTVEKGKANYEKLPANKKLPKAKTAAGEYFKGSVLEAGQGAVVFAKEKDRYMLFFGVEHATFIYCKQEEGEEKYYSYTEPFEGDLPDQENNPMAGGVIPPEKILEHLKTDLPEGAKLLQLLHSHNVVIRHGFGGKWIDQIGGPELSGRGDGPPIGDIAWINTVPLGPGVGISSTDGEIIDSSDPNQEVPMTIIK